MTTVAVTVIAAAAGLVVGIALTRAVKLLPLVIETATPTLFIAFAARLGPDTALPAYCVLAAGLIVLSVIDARTHRLPREVTYTTLAIGAPLLAVAALVDSEPRRLVEAAIGGAVLTIVFWLGHLVTRGGLGTGDVRLAPLLGVYLGYVSLSAVAIGIIAGLVAATLFGLVMLATRGRNDPYPFGPFLAVGTLLTLLVAGGG